MNKVEARTKQNNKKKFHFKKHTHLASSLNMQQRNLLYEYLLKCEVKKMCVHK